MVPNIEHVHPELEIVALFNSETLLNREVPVLLIWTAERIPRRVAITGCAGPGRERNVVGHLRTRRPAIDVQIMRNLRRGRAAAVSSLSIRTNKDTRARAAAKRAAAAVSY